MKLDIKNYPGSKGASGVIEFLVNHTPDCDVFVDGMGGSGIVSSRIAELNKNQTIIYFEIVNHVLEQFKNKNTWKNIHFKNESVIKFYSKKIYKEDSKFLFEDTVFFFDPPYKFETRRTERPMYEHEWGLEQHIEFLSFVRQLSEYTSAKIMITHPMEDDYVNLLINGEFEKEWFTSPFSYMGRGGVMYDTLWTNFNPKEESLLSYKYVGKNNTDRQRIKRKIKRLVEKIEALPYHEQQAIVTEIASLKH